MTVTPLAKILVRRAMVENDLLERAAMASLELDFCIDSVLLAESDGAKLTVLTEQVAFEFLCEWDCDVKTWFEQYA